jgi:HEAT repeat protein
VLHNQVGQMMGGLQDQDPHVRLVALEALESIGELRQRLRKRVASVPLFIGAKGAQMANSAVEALQIDVLEPVVHKLDDVARLLADPDVRIRRAAVDLLDVLEESAAPTIPALAQVLSDPYRNIRHAAVRALGHIAPDKSAAVAQRIAALVADTDRDVSLAAIATLEAIGPAAKESLPMLIEAIRQGGPDVRVAAMNALPRIGLQHATAAIPAAIDALEACRDARVRRAAAELLGRFGPAARQAVPALRNRLGDDDAEVRIRASDAILNILTPSPE